MAETTIHDILAQFREEELHNRHLGDRFERLICRYLELDPLFADRFSNVWMWNEWPKKGNSGDTGIDIVAEERATGEFCGIQCKFYLPDHTLSKDDIDSYLNALGDKRLTSGIIVSTTDKWGSNAEKSLLNRDKPVNRLRAQDLDDSPIDWSKFSLKNPQMLSLKKTLRPHQKSAKTDVIAGLAEADRGKLIMACGIGKTFTSLRAAEETAPTGHVLFLVPSLSLLSQSLREWTAEAGNPIHALAVCSDVNIGKRSNRDAFSMGCWNPPIENGLVMDPNYKADPKCGAVSLRQIIGRQRSQVNETKRLILRRLPRYRSVQMQNITKYRSANTAILAS